jgi:predicted metal-dependent hydrolase
MAGTIGSARFGRAQAVRFFDIEHDGLVHRIALKRVATARRFTLRVRSARRDVVLTLPPHGSSSAARTFALRHADWIAEKLAALPAAVPFAPGQAIPFRGRLHVLCAKPGLRSRVVAEEGANGPKLCVSGPGAFDATLMRFLRAQAKADLIAAAERHASGAGRPIRGLTLRDTRSRWGSCSSRGRLNFSWRLILAPPFVLDYLAAHEAAHLVHMNHSAAFWALVRRLFPDIEAAEAWLKQSGASLHRYG